MVQVYPNCTLSLLPIAAGTVLFVAAGASYAIGVIFDKRLEGEYVPYPSDLMVHQPQRGIFAIGLGVGGCLSFAVIVLRYIQVRSFRARRCSNVNVISLIFGVLMIIGQSSVAAFSLEESMIAHFTLASLYFANCCLYMITQTHISRSLKRFHSSAVSKLRLALSIIGSICPFAYAFGRSFAPKEEHRYRIPHVAEWLLALVTIVFTISFCCDFAKVRFRSFLVAKVASEEGDNTPLTYQSYLRNHSMKSKVGSSANPDHQPLTTADV